MSEKDLFPTLKNVEDADFDSIDDAQEFLYNSIKYDSFNPLEDVGMLLSYIMKELKRLEDKKDYNHG